MLHSTVSAVHPTGDADPLQREHSGDIERGVVKSPLVEHSIVEHGGRKPEVIFLIDTIEPRALYRAVIESVKIANMIDGPTKMNRCNEWGAPRVPVITVSGGDEDRDNILTTGSHNERKEWTAGSLRK